MITTAILNNSLRTFSRHTRLSPQASVSSQLSQNVRHQHQQAVRRYRTRASTEYVSREGTCSASSQRRLDRSVAASSTWMHSLSSLRGFHSSAVSRHMGIDRPAPGSGIKVNFQDSKGNLLKTVEANEGDDILAIAHEYDIDLEGACEGSVACSTCHVILPPEYYDLLPEPEDDENDMLDMAFGLTDTSRLGCQVKLTKEMDGMDVRLPAATRNMFVDGKKASH